MSAEGWTAYDTVQAWTAYGTYRGQAEKFYATPSEGAQFRAALDAAQKAQRETKPSGKEIAAMTSDEFQKVLDSEALSNSWDRKRALDAWLAAGPDPVPTSRRSPFAGGRVSRVVDLAILAALLVGSVAVVFIVGSAIVFMVAAALGLS